MKWLITRIWYERRWFVIGWSMAFGIMSALIMMFYPSFSQGGGFDTVAKNLPKQLQGFIGDPSVFASLEGFITAQVYDVRMSLFLIIMTVVLALGLTVREEERGQLRTLLSTSISRDRVVAETFLAAIGIIAVLNLVSIAGLYIGITALGEDFPHSLIWQLYGLSTVFGVVAFAIPFAIGLATGRRGVTLMISLTVAIGSYLLSTFAAAVDWLEPWEWLSIIYYYDTTGIREGAFDVLNLWVYAVIIATVMTVGWLRFRTRDIA